MSAGRAVASATSDASFRSRLWLVVLLGAVGSFAPISVDMYLPAFPDVASDFDTSIGAVQLTLSTSLAGLALGQVVYGPLSDAIGRRGPLAAGAVLFVGASIGCALAPSIGALIALRFVQAFGGCAGLVIARAIVRDLFSGAAAARFFSLIFAVTGLAPILAPVLGAQLLRVGSWRWIFVVLAVLGLACLAGMTRLPETLAPERRQRGGAARALVSYRLLLANRRYVVHATTSGLVLAAMFAYIAAVPGVLIDVHGVSPTTFSLIFGANAIGLVVASQIGGRALRRRRPASVLRVSVAVQTAAALCLVVTAAADIGGLAGILVPLFFVVSSVGAVILSAIALALEPFPDIAGAASAFLGMLQQLVGAAAASVVSFLATGSATVMAAVIAVLCVGAAALVCVPRYIQRDG